MSRQYSSTRIHKTYKTQGSDYSGQAHMYPSALVSIVVSDTVIGVGSDVGKGGHGGQEVGDEIVVLFSVEEVVEMLLELW